MPNLGTSPETLGSRREPVSREVEIAPGVHMPRLALGTFRIRGEDARRVVADAVVAGYAHVDTASCYRNEEDIARALAALARDHPASQRVFLTSKLSPRDMRDPDTALDGILCRLNLDPRDRPLDLALIHWPGVDKLPPMTPNTRIAVASLGSRSSAHIAAAPSEPSASATTPSSTSASSSRTRRYPPR